MICLAELGATLFQTGSREMIRLENPRELDFFESPSHELGHQSIEQHQADAPALIFGNNVGADHTHPFDLAAIPQQADEAKWEEPPVRGFDPRVVVQDRRDETDRFLVDFGKQC